MRRIQTIRITALAAALSAIYPLQALANAGVTQFAVGDVAVQRGTTSSNLSAGARLESGDTVTTGSTGRTQLRFTDGGMVSLQPNSQFKLTRYADSATGGGQDSFLVDLARGGMRAITGLIGKRSRESYKVTTTTATIGIRGSGFSMAYNTDGTLGVTTELDAIEVCTQAGCVGLNVGESVVVTDASSLPRRTFVRANWNAPNPNRKITARNEDVDAEGKTVTLQVDTGIAFTAAGLTEGDPDNRIYLNGALVSEEGSGKLKGYLSRGNVAGSGGTIEGEPYTQGSLAGGDLMILGTWASPVWSDSSTLINKSAFVAGVPTPEAGLRSMTDLRGRYDLYRATPVQVSYNSLSVPSVLDSPSLRTGQLLSTSHLLVDFRSAFASIDANLDILMQNPNSTQPLGESTYPDQGTYYNLRGSGTASGSGFSGTLAATYGRGNYSAEYIPAYSSYSNQVGTGKFQGFFGGPNGGTAGLSYSASLGEGEMIAGAGIFVRGSSNDSSLSQTTSVPVGNYYDSLLFQTHALDGSGVLQVGEGNAQIFTPGVSCCGPSASGQSIFSGTQLRSWDGGGEYGVSKLSASPVPAGASVQQYGAFGQPSDANFLGWGAWQAGQVQKSSIASGQQTGLKDVHYIVGRASALDYNQNQTWQGSAQTTYSFVGGTNPTATRTDGTTVVGKIGADSSLNIAFGPANPTVTTDIRLQFAGVTIAPIVQTGTLYSTGQIKSVEGSAQGQFSGILSGANGERAGIVYGINNLTLGQIRGAAVFQTATPPVRVTGCISFCE